MVELTKSQKAQVAFANHIRDPENSAAPANIEDRRMAVYRELIFNNIAGFIDSGFPVLKQIIPQNDWQTLIRQFLVEHRAQSPYFAEVTKEFLVFLEKTDSPLKQKYPFLEELAHYEWVELALMIDSFSVDSVSLKDSVDLLNDKIVLSEVAWPLVYEFDVQHISSDYQPRVKPDTPTFIVVYRNRHDDVEFTEINAVTFSLLQLLKNYPDETGKQVLTRLAAEIPQVPSQTIIDNGLDILLKLMKRDIILGVAKE